VHRSTETFVVYKKSDVIGSITAEERYIKRINAFSVLTVKGTVTYTVYTAKRTAVYLNVRKWVVEYARHRIT
jgi:hypothetical protein